MFAETLSEKELGASQGVAPGSAGNRPGSSEGSWEGTLLAIENLGQCASAVLLHADTQARREKENSYKKQQVPKPREV